MKPALLRPALIVPSLLAAILASCGLLAATGAAQPGPASPAATTEEADPPRVREIVFESDVNPVTQGYLTDELKKAQEDGYDAAVITLDTPGGLSASMRKIVKAELASGIPVIVYVSPDGARAASAGVWIGQAADILAMAPQTNIGSSTPISIGGEDIQQDLRRKVVNDAAAQLRALAASHGRNAKWADSAVRVASNLTAAEALERNVIDAIAPTLPSLLRQIDGQKTVPKGFVLNTAGAEISTVHMGLWREILNTLIDPNIITLLLSLGVLGIVVELYHPGLIFPAAFGILSLAIAFYGLDVLPTSWAGLLLIFAAFAFWAAEVFVPVSHGALTLAGAACFVFGALILFEPAGVGYSVSLPVVLAIAATISLLLGFVVSKVVQVRRRPPAIGSTSLVGTPAVARAGGQVAVHGELWTARLEEGAEPLRPGERVEVVGIDGLRLNVRRPEPDPPETLPSV